MLECHFDWSESASMVENQFRPFKVWLDCCKPNSTVDRWMQLLDAYRDLTKRLWSRKASLRYSNHQFDSWKAHLVFKDACWLLKDSSFAKIQFGCRKWFPQWRIQVDRWKANLNDRVLYELTIWTQDQQREAELMVADWSRYTQAIHPG